MATDKQIDARALDPHRYTVLCLWEAGADWADRYSHLAVSPRAFRTVLRTLQRWGLVKAEVNQEHRRLKIWLTERGIETARRWHSRKEKAPVS